MNYSRHRRFTAAELKVLSTMKGADRTAYEKKLIADRKAVKAEEAGEPVDEYPRLAEIQEAARKLLLHHEKQTKNNKKNK